MPAFRSGFATRFLLPASLIFLAVISAATLSGNSVNADQAMATYTRGTLALTIPYHSVRESPGTLTVEILDPEDHVLGRAERRVDCANGDGTWQQAITPEKPIAYEEIVWQRIRYRFEYSDGKTPSIEGIESISEILRRPVVRVLGQSEYLSGSEAAIRVIVSDANHNEIAETGTVRVELVVPDKQMRPLFNGRLNKRGTVEAQFRFPAGLTGKYNLRYIADTPIGSVEYTQSIVLADKASILLTTEKPIYQPGQTIHVRALALDRAGHKASAEKPLTFELEDSRGNKVFKKVTETDGFGVTSAEFALADEVNLGTYHLRALMFDPRSDAKAEADAPSDTAEIAINVERYVLPKFKVAVEFTEKDGKARSYYRPGDHVTGTVRANYFFGKPVDHAEITVKASAMDVALFEAASVSGKTDGDGVYHFDLKLPEYFAGKPLSQGAARALVEATVKDSAEHSETRGEPITISESSILLTAVPEGGTLVPHLENEVFLLSSYPDGTPASTTMTVHINNAHDNNGHMHDQQVTTDSGGVAVVRFTPDRFNPGAGLDSFHVDADDHRGNRASSTVALETRDGTDQILLRTDHAILKAGDPIHLKVLSTRTGGSAYVDIVKNGQTILTRDLDLQNGEADLSLIATPEMAGTLDIDAYLFGRDAQPVGDHRIVFVQPADELKIDTASDAAVYKPGSDATIHFHVTNSHGEGVSAALGLQIVDEAVFALAEKQPGFAKVFFYLEQEVMKPRYEIHSLSMPEVLHSEWNLRDRNEEANKQDLAARALFSATEMANPAKLDTEFGRTLPMDKFGEYQQRYREALVEQVRQITGEIDKAHTTPDDFMDAFNKPVHPRDAWNTPLRIENAPWDWGGVEGTRYYLVRSVGPDLSFETGDDLSVWISVQPSRRTVNIVRQPGDRGGTADVQIEHERGPFNGRAEITGTVTDATGAVIPRATITLKQTGTNEHRTTHSNGSGRFNFAGISAGSYRLQLESPGFLTASADLTVHPRDRAVVSMTLAVGNVMEAVEVTGANEVITINANMPMPAPMDGARFRRGIALAAIGGAVAMKAMPQAMMMAPTPAALNVDVAKRTQANGLSFDMKMKASAPVEPHVRSWFPEALYINPEIFTDGHGDATISIPIADSITTWRMAMLASTKAGALGTGTSSLKVFQDFFVDLDLPVTLTQGDRVSIPIGVYSYTDKNGNYSGKPGDVSLKLQPDEWYTLDNDTADKSLNVDSGHVGSSQFTLAANKIGRFKLTLRAHMEGAAGQEGRDDIIVREIEVIPNGREQDAVFNGRLEHSAAHAISFPANAIPDASSVLVRLYPGPLSQVIEGMDSILQMPGGCFEQTSSSTYPNVLALDYMKRTKKLTPEVHAKAEGYIANGYQRLLTFEVPGGGFSWFGQAPANKILTAYGLMEFNDMSKVSDVDQKVIDRTRDWLISQQQPDGSWKPDTSFINEGATNRYNTNVGRITAYIAWSLANTGYQGPAVLKAKHFIETHSSEKLDTYTLAVIANFAVDYRSNNEQDREFTRHSMQALLDARTEKGDMVSWNAEETGVYSTGASAAIETTGLAAQALLKWGQASETTRKALSFISSKKQAAGNWGTTQATIMALRALLLASQLSAADVHGTVHITLNGKPVETLELTKENNDLLHQFVFKGISATEPASVQLSFEGTGGLAYQVVGRYFIPWEQKPANEALSIDIAYDRSKLAQNDIATATATIRNNLPQTANMVMVDLGIPPGFDLLSEDLQALQEKSAGAHAGRLEKFSLTATQAIL